MFGTGVWICTWIIIYQDFIIDLDLGQPQGQKVHQCQTKLQYFPSFNL